MSLSSPEMLFILTANFLDDRCIWAFEDPVSSLGLGCGVPGPPGKMQPLPGESPTAHLVEKLPGSQWFQLLRD